MMIIASRGIRFSRLVCTISNSLISQTHFEGLPESIAGFATTSVGNFDETIQPKLQSSHVMLDESQLEEKFSKGSGPGGQCVNKRSNKVQLTHLPTGISVTCHDFRDLTANRKHARTLLKQKIDYATNGRDSKLGRAITKIQKRKAKKKSRSDSKYGNNPSDLSTNSDEPSTL